KIVDFGLYLDGGEGVEILLPKRYMPQDVKVGDELKVFVYHDAEARIIATNEQPYATVGPFAYLKINSVNAVGAFADWGTSKELLIPHREQAQKMEEGRRYIIYIYIDQLSGRIVGTGKIDKHLGNVPPAYEEGQEVEALVWKQTNLGYKVIINQQHAGLLYHNQIFQEIRIGERLRAWVKGVREDDKIDLSLQPIGYRQMIDPAEASILKALHRRNGFLPLTDHSTPELIASELQMSKKTFKKAIGALYKQQRISLLPDGIQLLDNSDE
ncbi:MAG: GntR family transcriptional regulator, partial [Bacteroidales bacterium]|nr:GntR family transcriptional regulator [Bacteroidales bacterium]